MAVAVKMPKDDMTPAVRVAFQKEMAMLASVGQHPYIVRCAAAASDTH